MYVVKKIKLNDMHACKKSDYIENENDRTMKYRREHILDSISYQFTFTKPYRLKTMKNQSMNDK
jgi:hypothetical protein